MKHVKIKGLLLVIMLYAGTLLCSAQETVKFPKLDASPADIALLRLEKDAPPVVKVIYGRPQKKGRTIFGGLVPYGKIWRTGANEASEITFYQDTEFGGQQVPAGTYVICTIPGKDKWTIILNKNLNVWGAFQYSQSADLLRFDVKPTTAAEVLEPFSIAFDQGPNKAMVLGWDTTRVRIPLKFK